MLGDSDIMAFVSTADLGRARAFYADMLGLHLHDVNPYACVFDAHGVMLRVTAAETITPAPYTVLGWRVHDIATKVCALQARGVATLRYDGMTQDGDGIWTTPSGDRVAWFRDPDANVLSMTELA
jgi:catechol 2,3-dioxygenase-like lactoylglutathione lyase family enzyme